MVKARRILLIDSESAIQEVVQVCLEMVAGWEVLTASSDGEGVVKAETEQIDAIFLDLDSVMMSNLYWLQVFQKLQNNPATQQIPVVLLAATVSPQDIPQFIKLGASAVLAKPYDLVALASLVATALDWQL